MLRVILSGQTHLVKVALAVVLVAGCFPRRGSSLGLVVVCHEASASLLDVASKDWKNVIASAAEIL